MLVGKRMSHPVITMSPELPIVDALNLMKREWIRRAPVVKDSKMVGIVSDKDLLNASASPTTFVGGTDMYFGNDRLDLVRDAVLRRRATTGDRTS